MTLKENEIYFGSDGRPGNMVGTFISFDQRMVTGNSCSIFRLFGDASEGRRYGSQGFPRCEPLVNRLQRPHHHLAGRQIQIQR